MALNADQLIDKFLALRYPIPEKDKNCRIAIREMQEVRARRNKRIREELKELPEKDKREVLNKMIEKELCHL